MATITEDYVSFETAKLLKKKGFNEPCKVWYAEYTSVWGRYKKYIIIQFDDKNKFDESYKFLCHAPTLQMAMKWLREVYKIYIDISPTYSEVEKAIHFIWQIFDSNYDGVGDCEIFYDKYETTCEAAIKFCLEKLI